MTEVAAAFSAAHSCTAVSRKVSLPWTTEANQLSCFEHETCETGRRVLRCTWNGAHDWPKLEGVAFGNELLWQFFQSNVTELH